VIAFIDQIALPFLQSLYGAVGYVGVMLAMAIESAMIPLPSELILPLAGFMVSDPGQLEPLTKGPWGFWIVVIVATLGNTIGSLVAYATGAYGGRGRPVPGPPLVAPGDAGQAEEVRDAVGLEGLGRGR
jgi:membrane protein DedA with SNARE-associated domain